MKKKRKEIAGCRCRNSVFLDKKTKTKRKRRAASGGINTCFDLTLLLLFLFLPFPILYAGLVSLPGLVKLLPLLVVGTGASAASRADQWRGRTVRGRRPCVCAWSRRCRTWSKVREGESTGLGERRITIGREWGDSLGRKAKHVWGQHGWRDAPAYARNEARQPWADQCHHTPGEWGMIDNIIHSAVGYMVKGNLFPRWSTNRGWLCPMLVSMCWLPIARFMGSFVILKHASEMFQNPRPDSAGKECLPSLHVLARRCFPCQPVQTTTSHKAKYVPITHGMIRRDYPYQHLL